MSNYNPYDAAKSIVENKQKWTNARAKGEDPTRYADDAVTFYEQLRSNGRSDVADYLQKSDAIEATEYLKKLKGDYKPTVEGTQQKSNDVYETGKAYGQDIKQSFDTVYKNNINVDPTSTGYGKNIRAGYQGAANGAYKSTLAGGADDNNGNVDSFAAANANRQKAAIISQGNDDILKFYDTIAGRANEWAGNKANALTGNLSQLQGNVDSDREMIVQDRNADLAAEQTAADKLKSLYDYLGISEKADADRYGAEKDLEGVVYKADKDLEGVVYKADTDKDISAAGNASAAYVQQLKNAGKTGNGSDGEYTLPVSAKDVANAIIGKYTTQKWDNIGDDYDPEYKSREVIDWAAANKEMTEALTTGKYSSYSDYEKQQILNAYNLAGGNVQIKEKESDVGIQAGNTRNMLNHLSLFNDARTKYRGMTTPTEKENAILEWWESGELNDEEALYLMQRVGLDINKYIEH